MTNGESIRSMTDEQLATFLNKITVNCFDLGNGFDQNVCLSCPLETACRNSSSCDTITGWLRQEACV